MVAWLTGHVTSVIASDGQAINLILFVTHFSMVQSYLVHHGYSATAETFAKTTGQGLAEDLTSIKNRQSELEWEIEGEKGFSHDLCSTFRNSKTGHVWPYG